MLEIVERVLAAIILLGLLVIIMFIAFPRPGVDTARNNTPTTSTQQPLTGPSELPKSDAEPFSKVVGRHPDSSGATPIYTGRRKSPEPSTRRRYYDGNRDRRPPEHYVTRAEYDDPWNRTDYYECAGGSCDCSCNRPYWARSGPCSD